MKCFKIIISIIFLTNLSILSQELTDFSVYVSMISEQKKIEKDVLSLLIEKELILESRTSDEHANLSFMSSNKNHKNINRLCSEIMRKHIPREDFISMDKEVFLCKEVFLSEGIYCQGATVLKLYNNKLGTIYYLHQPNWKFPFSMKEMVTIPEDFLCNTIEKEFDKFSNTTKFHTSTKGLGDDGMTDNISFHRIDREANSQYFMRVKKFGSTPSTGEGVTILFKDGTRITKDVKTEVKVGHQFLTKEPKFEHSAFFELSESEVLKMSHSDMDAIKIFIFDQEISTPWKYRAYIKCLIESE